MSLNASERRRTRDELAENFRRSGRTPTDVERDLGISERDLDAVLAMDDDVHPATTWLVRDYLVAEVEAAGGEVFPFTSLTEQMRDAARGWFGIADLDDVRARPATP
ncbi:DUF2316 family protein [Cellulomonas sp. HZM]|uniref:DUF2316 family protein n=1 Tax=Cellulomonas sp. HZM TaxID=1454010 RepID=UPI00068AB950|nr:DUF2316 family protein [Cellulomonas sp. HZM]